MCYHLKSIEANDSRGMAILDTWSIDGRVYVGGYKHKPISCESCHFRKYDLKVFPHYKSMGAICQSTKNNMHPFPLPGDVLYVY